MSKQVKLSAKVRTDIRYDAEHNCEGASVADTLRLLDDHETLLLEVEQLKKAATRYEYLRKLDPNKFGNIWKKNITTGIPFDTLIDEAIEQKHA